MFPLCWRCTAIAAGALAVEASSGAAFVEPGAWTAAMALAAVVPTAIDGYLSNLSPAGSTNVRRAFSGLLAGAGLGVLLQPW